MQVCGSSWFIDYILLGMSQTEKEVKEMLQSLRTIRINPKQGIDT
jgi:primosomal protein N'